MAGDGSKYLGFHGCKDRPSRLSHGKGEERGESLFFSVLFGWGGSCVLWDTEDF